MRERYDVATARAVANLPVLAEYCMPLIKMKGHFIAMKGPGAEQELEEAANALETLGAGSRRCSPSPCLAGGAKAHPLPEAALHPKGYPAWGTILKHPL